MPSIAAMWPDGNEDEEDTCVDMLEGASLDGGGGGRCSYGGRRQRTIKVLFSVLDD